jgi:hypothetical protein
VFFALIALVLTGGIAVWYEWWRRHYIARRIREYFYYLDVSIREVRKFVDAFETEVYTIRRNPLKLDEISEDVYLSFLLSTDFFVDESETRPLKFVTLYYWGLTACYNPLTKRLLPNGSENI